MKPFPRSPLEVLSRLNDAMGGTPDPCQHQAEQSEMASTKQNDQDDTSKRGFASMDDDKQREIASKGGKASHGSTGSDSDRGGQRAKQNDDSDDDAKGGSSRGKGGGNFADDPERAREAGRKGGEHSHGGQSR